MKKTAVQILIAIVPMALSIAAKNTIKELFGRV